MSDLREKIADVILCASGEDDYLHAADEIISLCQPQWISVVEYIAETQGRIFLLDKGYRPALEALVLELGYAEEHHGNRLLVTLPKPPETTK